MPYAGGQMPELRQGMGDYNMTPQAAAHELQKLLESVQSVCHQSFRTIFDDFCELATGSFHNMLYTLGGAAVPNAYRPVHDALEQSYKKIFDKYTGTTAFDIFADALAKLTLAMKDEPFDYLGTIYMNAGIGNASAGQFFTPPHICELMAHFSIGSKEEAEQQIAERGWFSAADPCCGSGAMMIGLYKVLRDWQLPDIDTKILIELTDIDYLCVKMAFVQMSVLGLSARITWGNALTEEREMTLDTPALQLALTNGYFQPREPQESSRLQQKSRTYNEPNPPIPAGQLTLF
jgi:type I restriction-modification system DNA methylase subunit